LVKGKRFFYAARQRLKQGENASKGSFRAGPAAASAYGPVPARNEVFPPPETFPKFRLIL
jgi:hypothetical protein